MTYSYSRSLCRYRYRFLHVLLLLLAFGWHHHLCPAVSASADLDEAYVLSPVVQDHVDWFVSLLNGTPLNVTEYNERVSDDVLASLTAEEFADVVAGLRDIDDTWAMTEVVFSVPSGAIVRLTPAVTEPEMLLNLSVDDDGRINGLLVGPAEPPVLDNPPKTIEEAADRLSGLGEYFNYLVADVSAATATNGGALTCSESNILSASGSDEPTPIGSIFKLYVLGAVVDAVNAGTIAWDQPVELVDEYKSIPSGITQDDPPGSNRTVMEMATLMMSISDNTATDHLMVLVGRDAVEAAVSSYGHHMPDLNIPFISTREFSLLKLDGKSFDGGLDNHDTSPGPIGQEYIDAVDVAERRRILADLRNSSVDGLDLTRWVQEGPVAVEEIEWFASPLDLCTALVRLQQDEVASEILSANPGIPDEQGLFSYIGYKGGSEPGVFGMAWYVEAAADGARRVVTGTVWDPDLHIKDQTEAALLLGAMRDLSAASGDPTSGSVCLHRIKKVVMLLLPAIIHVALL
mmetsp:Transcript_20141/g.41062  ORF Transcript_20141/g.41062 Transcript_20141/m.41062 type:complete len:517 (+) Transcript_20141:268-1818(+)